MSETVDNEIIRRWHGGQSLRGIARDLGINRKRVTRTIRLHQEARQEGPGHPDLPRPGSANRPSLLDAFQAAIEQWLERYPEISVVRLLEELRRSGYQGSYTILRERVKELRGRPAQQPVVRFETAPGVQAQMDWSVYDIDFSQQGRRRVNLFSYLLSYSRRAYLCFTERQDFDTTLIQHIRAFEHLQGLAAHCLYDNMKVVVQRWQDEQPIYNTRFLAFATHYGYRPQACRPRRPQTKGKVERPFHYVETNLLAGREFRSLEHLNEVTRWWLDNVADVRVHRTTGRRPLDAHAEELPHLLPLPQHHYDTARVVYRLVDAEGLIHYGQNRYSVPWRWLGEILPVRVTEDQLLVYNRRIEQVACHPLVRGQTGQKQTDPAHRPPKDDRKQVELLRQQFAELGEVASRFLEGLLAKQRCGKHQARRVLALLRAYDRSDALAAIQRAVQYHAYCFSSLERILQAQATPQAPWQTLSQGQEELLRELSEAEAVPPRSSADYQHLLFDEDPDEQPPPDERPETP